MDSHEPRDLYHEPAYAGGCEGLWATIWRTLAGAGYAPRPSQPQPEEI